MGVYTFTITGQVATLMRGHGVINTSNNTFSGELMCDPATVNAGCGTNGRYWCGSDASCAWNNANYYGRNTHNYYYGGGNTVGVAAISIQNVTTIR